MAATTGRISTGQSDQLLFDIAFDLDLVRPRRLGPVVDGRPDPFDDKPFANAADSPQADAQGVANLFVGSVAAGGGMVAEPVVVPLTFPIVCALESDVVSANLLATCARCVSWSGTTISSVMVQPPGVAAAKTRDAIFIPIPPSFEVRTVEPAHPVV